MILPDAVVSPKIQVLGLQGKFMRRLSQSQFDAVKLLLGVAREDRTEMARQHLVEGVAMSKLAKQNGCSRQSVQASVDRVWSMAERFHEAMFIVLGASE